MDPKNEAHALAAKSKLKSGALMTLDEVAATFDVSPQAVHAIPLASLRIGRALRFDPRDVRKLIAHSKEPVIT